MRTQESCLVTEASQQLRNLCCSWCSRPMFPGSWRAKIKLYLTCVWMNPLSDLEANFDWGRVGISPGGVWLALASST